MGPGQDNEGHRRRRPIGDSGDPPFAASVVAAGKVSRGGLHSDGSSFVWTESRPDDGGRQVVVADGDGDPPLDLSPVGVSVRTRVHEYGGSAALATPDTLVYVDADDQRLYAQARAGGRAPVPLVPAADPGTSVRYADPVLLPSGRWLACIEERVEDKATTHRLVAVATGGPRRVVPLVTGGDFVAAPRVSPGGSRLAWVTWDHPAMPWDSSELWCGALVEGASGPVVEGAHRLAGGGACSVGQPLWLADGGLAFVDDRSGWWLPYRIAPGDLDAADPEAAPLAEVEAEFHAPDWVVGQRTMVETAGGALVCRMHRRGRDHLVRLHPPDPSGPGAAAPGWSLEVVDQPCVTIAGVAGAPATGRLAVLGSTPSDAAVVLELTQGADGPARRLSARPTWSPAAADVATARPVVAATGAGPVPGLFFAPVEAGGATAEPPPLVVFCHGGPTGATEPGFDPVVQFFTSKGLAVAGVDYRGSTGYGRAYRQLLRGEWGVADVADCTAYALALAEAGEVDGSRMAIRGTSAGGLTALGALVGGGPFAGAVAWYGVTDLATLAADTHDFESRYLDGLVGPWPAAADEYHRRSPLHRADEVRGAVLLLQGADDPVVPLSQAERLAGALARRGVRCELEVFEGESHGFRRAATIEACLAAELAFYRSLFTPGPH